MNKKEKNKNIYKKLTIMAATTCLTLGTFASPIMMIVSAEETPPPTSLPTEGEIPSVPNNPTAGSLTVDYKLCAGCAGGLSEYSKQLNPGENVGTLPTLIFNEDEMKLGWKLVNFTDEDTGTVFTETTLVNNNMTIIANTMKDINNNDIDDTTEEVTISFVRDSKSDGGLSITNKTIPLNTNLGDANVAVFTGTDWVFDGYYLDNIKISKDDLASLTFTADKTVKLVNYPDKIGQGVDNTNTPDGIDDRTQAIATFIADKNSINTKLVVIKNEAIVAPDVPDTGDGYRLKQWDKDINAGINADTTFTAQYEAIMHPFKIVGHDGTTYFDGTIQQTKEIKYVYNDKNETKKITVDGSTNLLTLPEISLPGKTLSNWSISNIDGGKICTPTYTDNEYKVTYSLREGDEGTLSLNSVDKLLYGHSLKDVEIPNVTFDGLDGNYVIDGFYINGKKYTKSELIGMQVLSDINVEVRVFPDNVGNGTENATDKADGIDDRLQAVVKFVDFDDTVLKAQVIMKNTDASAPANPSNKIGYYFTAWDKDFTNVTQDEIIVKAKYLIHKYPVTVRLEDNTILFDTSKTGNLAYGTEIQILDKDNKYIVNEKLTNNAAFTIPTVPETDISKVFVNWKVDTTTTIGVVKITPVFKDKTFEVKFVDYDNSEISTQTVVYGKDANLPSEEPATKLGYHFKEWDKTNKNITADASIKATYEVNEYKIVLVNASGTELKKYTLDYEKEVNVKNNNGAEVKKILIKELVKGLEDKLDQSHKVTVDNASVVNGYTFSHFAMTEVNGNIVVTPVYTKNPVVDPGTPEVTPTPTPEATEKPKPTTKPTATPTTTPPTDYIKPDDKIDVEAGKDVVFKDEDGNVIQQVTSGKNGVKAPTAPKKEGYDFVGWKATKDKKGNMVVVAFYEEEKATPTPTVIPTVEPTSNPETTATPEVTPEITTTKSNNFIDILFLGGIALAVIAGVGVIVFIWKKNKDNGFIYEDEMSSDEAKTTSDEENNGFFDEVDEEENIEEDNTDKSDFLNFDMDNKKDGE